jgi:hypothetical protein
VEPQLTTPLEVETILLGADQAGDHLIELIERRLQTGVSSVTEATALIGGADLRARELSSQMQASLDNESDGFWSLAGSLVKHESIIDRLRMARRTATVRMVAALRKDQITVAHFLEQAAWPLLCRAWTTPLVFEGTMHPPDDTRSIWRQPAVRFDQLEDWCEVRPQHDALDNLIRNLLRRGPPDEHVQQTAMFLRDVSLQERIQEPSRLGTTAPVLLLGGETWPLAHLVTASLIPRADASPLTRESLEPARRAVRNLLGRDPLPELPDGITWQVCFDNEASATTPYQMEGPSASLSLAIALLERSLSLGRRENVLATAQLLDDSRLAELSRGEVDPGLVAKGTTVQLLSPETHLVTAGENDARLARKHTISPATRIISVPRLEHAAGVMIPGSLGGLEVGLVGVTPAGGGPSRPSKSNIRKLAESSIRQSANRIVLCLPDLPSEITRALIEEMLQTQSEEASPGWTALAVLHCRDLSIPPHIDFAERLAEVILSRSQTRPPATFSEAARALIAAGLRTGAICLVLSDLLADVDSDARRVERRIANMVPRFDGNVQRVVVLAKAIELQSHRVTGLLTHRFEFGIVAD